VSPFNKRHHQEGSHQRDGQFRAIPDEKVQRMPERMVLVPQKMVPDEQVLQMIEKQPDRYKANEAPSGADTIRANKDP